MPRVKITLVLMLAALSFGCDVRPVEISNTAFQKFAEAMFTNLANTLFPVDPGDMMMDK
jgi:hypothetical protein